MNNLLQSFGTWSSVWAIHMFWLTLHITILFLMVGLVVKITNPSVVWKVWTWRFVHLKLLFLLLGLPALSLQVPASWSTWLTQSITHSSHATHSSFASSDPLMQTHTSRTIAKKQNSLGSLWRIPLLCLLWLLGCFYHMKSWLKSWRKARKLLAQSASVQEPWLEDLYQELSRTMGYETHLPKLQKLVGLSSPVVLGFWKPTIILPKEEIQEKNASLLRVVLAHELAHIQNKDQLWVWMPLCVKALFFFHPFVWFVEREWCTLQEIAADEKALEVTRGSIAQYGKLLLRFATQPLKNQMQASLAFGGVHSTFTLKRRLLAMQHYDAFTPKKKVPTILSCALLIMLGVLPWQLTVGASTPKKTHTPKLVELHFWVQFGSQAKAVEIQVTTPFGKTASVRHKGKHSQWFIQFTPTKKKLKKPSKKRMAIQLDFSIQRLYKGKKMLTKPKILTLSGLPASMKTTYSSPKGESLRLKVLPKLIYNR